MTRPAATLRLRGASGPIDAQVHVPPTSRSEHLVVAFVDPATGAELCSTLGAIVVAIDPTARTDMPRLLEWIAGHAAELGASGDAIAVVGIGDDDSPTHDRRPQEHEMSTTVTDEQVRQLAETATPCTLALLWWGPERFKDGAEATEREHQRRMVSLRADGVIAILCPVGAETLAGIAIMTVPPEEAGEILDGDPCVQTGMMRREVLPCHGFPGDAVPATVGGVQSRTVPST